MAYSDWDEDRLEHERRAVLAEYDSWKEEGLSLNMSRGKPGAEQLELSRKLFDILGFDDCVDDGIDARNYGALEGMPCARKYWAEMLDVTPEQCLVGGNSSLAMMYDLIAKAWTNGLLHSPEPWDRLEHVKFLCPCPGYDRHFRITQSFGIELIPIPMTDDGPDMNLVERYVEDSQVKGIWCVPKYSNPGGITYSETTIERFAKLKPKAPDFVIVWDNAYFVHQIRGDNNSLPNIITLCEKYGNADMVYEFASTSKMTIPGDGMAVLVSSLNNIKFLKDLMISQMISYDKVNQVRQVRFLHDKENTLKLMQKHAEILRPRFDAFLTELEKLRDLGIAKWTNPKGGYFISLFTMNGCASRTIELCRKVGLVMTKAGAAYPYGRDPEDRHIRIAPSYPPLDDVKKAAKVFCTCLKLAAIEKILG